MKRTIFLSLIVLFLIGCCTQEKKLPLEGAWELVYGQWQGLDRTFPASIKGSNTKVWTKDYSMSVGRFQRDTIVINTYVGGKYTLDGTKYLEDLIYHTNQKNAGQKARLILELKNDTIVLRFPADENWNLAEQHSTEKYVRLK